MSLILLLGWNYGTKAIVHDYQFVTISPYKVIFFIIPLCLSVVSSVTLWYRAQRLYLLGKSTIIHAVTRSLANVSTCHGNDYRKILRIWYTAEFHDLWKKVYKTTAIVAKNQWRCSLSWSFSFRRANLVHKSSRSSWCRRVILKRRKMPRLHFSQLKKLLPSVMFLN